MSAPTGNLASLASAVLQPGFVGTTPPDWVRRWLGEGLGAVVLFARNVVDADQVARLTTALRSERPDVLVAIDEEAGDVTRFECRWGSSRPGNLALGAVDDPALTEAVARDLGLDLRSAGINLNYAPDADVNSNPGNPVIGVRSFGADPALVARHTAAWVRGLQSAGVAACAKHFPGHGDTSVDSHLSIPRITAGRRQLDGCELPPFRAAIQAGVQAVMTGHLLVPALDPTWPATLSRRVLVGLLREELGFTGAVITDGIEMRAIVDRYGIEEATVLALAAGVDAVCVGGDHADEQTAQRLRQAVVDAVRSGRLPEERLVEAAKRVGQLAAWAAETRATSGRPEATTGAGPAGPSGYGETGATTPAGPHPAFGPGSAVGARAARRAVRLTRRADPHEAPRLPLTGPAHVVELATPGHLAIGAETPWGLGEPLAALLPGTTVTRCAQAELSATPDPLAVLLPPAAGRPLVVVVRDLHRHDWLADVVDRLLGDRPDAIVVELGVPARVTGGVHVATHGASRANAWAAAAALTGR